MPDSFDVDDVSDDDCEWYANGAGNVSSRRGCTTEKRDFVLMISSGSRGAGCEELCMRD